MSQTRVLKFFKRKETAKIKLKQTSINAFCVKKDRHMFYDEVICLNPRKNEETARPVGIPRKYDNNFSENELRDFNDGIMKSTVNSALSRQNQKPHEKDLALKKRRNKAFSFGLWKTESHQGFKDGKAWKRNAKGAGRPLSYLASTGEKLLSWLLTMNDLHLLVSY